MIDNIIYKIENMHDDIDEAIREDRDYFLERKEELLENIKKHGNPLGEKQPRDSSWPD